MLPPNTATGSLLKSAVILVACILFQRLHAQDYFSLTGKITDSIGTPLYPGTIQVVNKVYTLTTISDSTGAFTFTPLHSGILHLHISMRGYTTFDGSITLTGRPRAIHLKPVTLSTDYSDLDPVTISRPRPLTISGDTISYNASAFPVRDGSVVQDILQRLPGVEVDGEGNVIVQGTKITRVMVNGKEFFGGDVLLAIRNLPADVVSKLQVIDDYGDKARLTGIKVGEPAKMLNIVLQSDKRNGVFGHLQAGDGTMGKYAEEVFMNRFKAEKQLSANASAADNSPSGKDPGWTGSVSYADQWFRQWGGSLSANLNGNTATSGGGLQQQSFFPGQQIDLTESTTRHSQSANVAGNGIVTWKPTPYLLMRVSPSFSDQRSAQSDNMTSSVAQSGSNDNKKTQSTSAAGSQAQNTNAGVAFYVEKSYPTGKRRFSLEGVINYARQTQNNDVLTNTHIVSDSIPAASFLHTLTANPIKNLNLNINGNYFLPLGRQSFFEVAYHLISTQSQTSTRTLAATSPSGSLAAVDSLSIDQTYRTLVQQIHAGYLGEAGPLNINLAADLQPTSLSGATDAKSGNMDHHYVLFLPHAVANWRMSVRQTLTIQYQGNANLPSLQQLNPVTILTNPQYPVAGNPNLKPSWQHSASVHYEYANQHPLQFVGFGASLGYNRILDPILTSYTHPKDSSAVIQRMTYANAGQITSAYVNYHLTLPALFHRILRISGSGSISRNMTPSLIDGVLYTVSSFNWSHQLHVQVLIPDKTEINISGNYSITHSTLSSPTSLPGNQQTAVFIVSGKQYVIRRASIAWQFNQPYVSAGSRLKPAPCALVAGLKYDFLRHNKASVSLMGYNLVNSMHYTSQSISPTMITQTQANLSGPYFLAACTFKLERFR